MQDDFEGHLLPKDYPLQGCGGENASTLKSRMSNTTGKSKLLIVLVITERK